jgi:uncharacterized protein YndB with AHSA1/START domain
VQSRTAAPVDAVWPLIGEAHRWKEWSFLDRTDLAAEGTPEPDGVGAIRRFTSHGVGSREEVVAWDPPHHLGYAILSGFPVRHYRADVVLTPDGSDGTGTSITWSGTFDELVPGTGRVLQAVLTKLMGRFATSLAAYAARQARD